jgi:hypothetical protein
LCSWIIYLNFGKILQESQEKARKENEKEEVEAAIDEVKENQFSLPINLHVFFFAGNRRRNRKSEGSTWKTR